MTTDEKPLSILIIDDDDDFAGYLIFVLTTAGHVVNRAANGKQAKEFLAKNAPDVILSDIMMPDTTGIELCQWIHSQPSTKDVPLIQMSGLTNEAIVEDSMDSGVMDYLAKPFDAETLKQKIELAMKKAGRRKGGS